MVSYLLFNVIFSQISPIADNRRDIHREREREEHPLACNVLSTYVMAAGEIDR